MSKYDEEYMKILGAHNQEIKIDGGTIVQRKVLEQKIPKPTIKSRIIEVMKRLGIKVTYIDPVTFKESNI